MREKLTLADMIKQSRMAMGMTLRELEEATNISYSQLSKIERGDSIPNRENLEILAKKFDLDINQLLILSGTIPNEITIENAQFIYDIWGDDNSLERITASNNNTVVQIPVKIPEHTSIEYRDDIDEDWAKFIKEMKKRKITPQQLREVLSTMRNIQKYMNQVEVPE